MTSKNESVSRQNPWAGIRETIESLRLRFFGISREPRTSISHVTRALPSGLQFDDFLELFCLLVIEFYFKKRNFEDNFSAKIEVNEWKQTR